MKFTKEQFEKEYLKKKKDVDELYEPDDEFGGDKPELQSVSQVTTDTPKSFDDKSDHEEGQPIDTDTYSKNAKNKLSWNKPFGGNMGNYTSSYTRGHVREDETNESAKDKMERMIRELLQSKNADRDIVKQSNSNDLNNNNIPDIDELKKPQVITTVNEFISAVTSSNLNDIEIKTVFNHLFKSLDSNGVNIDQIKTKY
jgi:hypothetical protein